MALLEKRTKEAPCAPRVKILASTFVKLEATRSPYYPGIAIGYGGGSYTWQGRTYKRTEGLAEQTGQCRRSCERGVKDMVRLGWLTKRSPIEGRKPGGRGLANLYSLGPELRALEELPAEPEPPAPLPAGQSQWEAIVAKADPAVAAKYRGQRRGPPS